MAGARMRCPWKQHYSAGLGGQCVSKEASFSFAASESQKRSLGEFGVFNWARAVLTQLLDEPKVKRF